MGRVGCGMRALTVEPPPASTVGCAPRALPRLPLFTRRPIGEAGSRRPPGPGSLALKGRVGEAQVGALQKAGRGQKTASWKPWPPAPKNRAPHGDLGLQGFSQAESLVFCWLPGARLPVPQH